MPDETGLPKTGDIRAADLALTRPRGPTGTVMEPSYSGALSFMRRPYAKDPAGADVAVVGIPFDLATTGRPGARFGPRGLREASSIIAWDAVWGWDFDPFDRLDVVDAGDIAVGYGSPAEVVRTIEEQFSVLHAQGIATLMLGGDHFCTYPVLRSLARHVGQPLSLIHFDAHSDTWPGREGEVDHGTMFWHAARDGVIDPLRSVQLGIRTNNRDTLGMDVLSAAEVDRMDADAIARRIAGVVGDNPAYITFDIDFLDPAYAPGTGTPVPGGPSSLKAIEILRRLGGLDVRSCDVVEVAPAYDVGGVTALAGATIGLHCLAIMAARRTTG